MLALSCTLSCKRVWVLLFFCVCVIWRHCTDNALLIRIAGCPPCTWGVDHAGHTNESCYTSVITSSPLTRCEKEGVPCTFPISYSESRRKCHFASFMMHALLSDLSALGRQFDTNHVSKLRVTSLWLLIWMSLTNSKIRLLSPKYSLQVQKEILKSPVISFWLLLAISGIKVRRTKDKVQFYIKNYQVQSIKFTIQNIKYVVQSAKCKVQGTKSIVQRSKY